MYSNFNDKEEDSVFNINRMSPLTFRRTVNPPRLAFITRSYILMRVWQYTQTDPRRYFQPSPPRLVLSHTPSPHPKAIPSRLIASHSGTYSSPRLLPRGAVCPSLFLRSQAVWKATSLCPRSIMKAITCTQQRQRQTRCHVNDI